MSELYDVVAVNLTTKRVRLLATEKTLENAGAIVTMAILRRGVEDEFFVGAPVGKYKDGDEWTGNE